tara:strand:+ start:9589 stop:9747 length:159 start_codon:yes stop_codon:yes gene_type:complete
MSDKYIQIKVTSYIDVPIGELVDESIREWVSENIDIENDCDNEIEVLGVMTV